MIRREVEKHCDGANELQDGGGVRAAEAAVAYPVMKRKVIVSQAVDEDLYKVPQRPPMYEKPRKVYIFYVQRNITDRKSHIYICPAQRKN